MKYLVIDGNFFKYRAIHKMGELKRSDGVDTGMVFGFLRMLKTTADEIKPNKILVVFDGGLSPFRKTLLPEYKSNRTTVKRDDEEIRTIKLPDADGGLSTLLNDMLKALGIPVFQYDGVEADDIIGILSQLMEYDEKLIIASSDTDFMQLISNRVAVFNPIKKEYLTSPVEPKDYVVYKSIVGDISDNIHGIKGIGKVKALKKLNGPWCDADKEIIERNNKVIKIVTDTEKIFEYYNLTDIIDFKRNFMLWANNSDGVDIEEFSKYCKYMEFNSILSNISSWKRTFEDRETLDDIW